MKKVTSIILVLVMLIVFSSSALAKTKDELLFRSIPWGSTYKETMAALEVDGITWDDPSPYKTGERESETGFIVYSKKVMGFNVAGNKVSAVKLWFAYDTNKPSSKDSAVFVQAKYIFDADNAPSAIETDLKEKMITVYSEPDDTSEENILNDYTHSWCWYGSNNSSVMLRHDYIEPLLIKSLSDHRIELTYTSGKFDKLFNEYYEYLNKDNDKSTDGL